MVFLSNRTKLQAELLQHISTGGRISLTTDTWSARNYTEYTAVTGYWIDQDWIQHTQIFDVLDLSEPIHSGEYLASKLLLVTDRLGITQAVSTVTCDNASANNTILQEFEAEYEN
jgi:hypothetical protein